MPKYIFLLISLLVAFDAVFAETVILKNGKIIKGKVISQNSKILELKTESGKTERINKTNLLKVVYRDLNQEQADIIKKEEEKKLAALEKKQKEELAQKEKDELAQKEKDDKLKEELAQKEKDEQARLLAEKSISNQPKKTISRSGALWRSAVLPGWGQVANSRNEGFVLGSGFLVSGFAWYNKNREMKNAERDLGNLNNPFKTFILPVFPTDPTVAYANNLPFKMQQSAVDRHYREARNFGIMTVLFYGFNLFDAWYFYQDGTDKMNRSGVSARELMVKSAMLPGWGQIRDNRRTSGYAYSALFIFSLTGFYTKYTEMQEARKFQSALFNPADSSYLIKIPTFTDPVGLYLYNQPFEAQRRIVDGYYKEAKGFAVLALAVYLLNIADAGFFHKSKGAASVNVIFDAGIDRYSSNQQNSNQYMKFGYLYTF